MALIAQVLNSTCKAINAEFVPCFHRRDGAALQAVQEAFALAHLPHIPHKKPACVSRPVTAVLMRLQHTQRFSDGMRVTFAMLPDTFSVFSRNCWLAVGSPRV